MDEDLCTGVVCTVLDQCHEAGTCDPATGECSNPVKANGTSCNDGNACTAGDTCRAGVCTGGVSVTCDSNNPCVTDSCDPVVGCVQTPVAFGISCADGNACDGGEICDGAGACVDGTPIACGECLVCDPATGICGPDPLQEGAACVGDGNKCYGSHVCRNGTCIGEQPAVCTASDQCHNAGTCDPSTGECSNPAKTNGTACDDGNACTTGDVCRAGVCAGEAVSCPGKTACCAAGAFAGQCRAEEACNQLL